MDINSDTKLKYSLLATGPAYLSESDIIRIIFENGIIVDITNQLLIDCFQPSYSSLEKKPILWYKKQVGEKYGINFNHR